MKKYILLLLLAALSLGAAELFVGPQAQYKTILSGIKATESTNLMFVQCFVEAVSAEAAHTLTFFLFYHTPNSSEIGKS